MCVDIDNCFLMCVHAMIACVCHWINIIGRIGPPGNTGLTGEKGIDQI